MMAGRPPAALRHIKARAALAAQGPASVGPSVANRERRTLPARTPHEQTRRQGRHRHGRRGRAGPRGRGAAPPGHMGESDDIAWDVVYLASDEARFVTGAELVIDGGDTAR